MTHWYVCIRSWNFSRGLAALLCMLSLLAALQGCAPRGQAVGDSWKSGITAEHDGTDRTNIKVAIVAAANKHDRDGIQDTNTRMFDLLEHNGFTAYFADAEDAFGQEQAVADAVGRKVSFILVEHMGEANWSKSLRSARRAGIPVVLLGEGYRPQDSTLFAAQLYLDEQSSHSQPLGKAIQTIVDNREHPRRMLVNLEDDMTQHEPPDQIEEKL